MLYWIEHLYSGVVHDEVTTTSSSSTVKLRGCGRLKRRLNAGLMFDTKAAGGRVQGPFSPHGPGTPLPGRPLLGGLRGRGRRSGRSPPVLGLPPMHLPGKQGDRAARSG